MTAPLTPPSSRTRRIITVPPREAPTAQPTHAPRAAPPELDARTGPRALQLLGTDDLPWIADLTDAIAHLAGQPWRVALEAIEGGTWLRAADPAGERTATAGPSDDRAAAAGPNAIPPRRLQAATAALRGLLAGRPQDANLARKARSLLLGTPALDDATRAARIASVASQLAITPETLERILWADVPRERPIDLTGGRPTASEVAALANVRLLQRALAHAHSVELVVRGDASPILRGAAARGLIATASERDAPAAPRGAPTYETAPAGSAAPTRETATVRSAVPTRETALDIVGPLALCHGTAVYGRALGSLVPLLATCQSFTLTIRAESHGRAYELRVDSPALLPAPAPRRWALVERLATDLERIGAPRGIRVRRAPPALVERVSKEGALAVPSGALVCPDLGIDVGDRTIWIEVVGFWTPAYLARKLARYRAVGARDIVLCVDSTRACDDSDDPPAGACLLRFERRIHAEPLLQLVGALAPALSG